MKKRFAVFILFIIISVLSSCINTKETKEIDIKEETNNTEDNSNTENVFHKYNRNGNYCFYYFQLKENEQRIYNVIYDAIFEMSNIIEIDDDINVKDIKLIYKLILYDNPEIFWTKKIECETLGNKTRISLIYYYTYNEKEEQKERLEKWKETFLNTYSKKNNVFSSTINMELDIFDYISSSTNYNIDTLYNQTIVSVINGESVCMGYTKAYKYLCDEMKIPCVIIEGKFENELHAWNKVFIESLDENEIWRNIDVTYNKNYGLVFVTDKFIKKSYSISKISSENIEINYPKESDTSDKYDWYFLSGLYMKDINDIKRFLKDKQEIIIRTSDDTIEKVSNNKTLISSSFGNRNVLIIVEEKLNLIHVEVY